MNYISIDDINLYEVVGSPRVIRKGRKLANSLAKELNIPLDKLLAVYGFIDDGIDPKLRIQAAQFLQLSTDEQSTYDENEFKKIETIVNDLKEVDKYMNVSKVIGDFFKLSMEQWDEETDEPTGYFKEAVDLLAMSVYYDGKKIDREKILDSDVFVIVELLTRLVIKPREAIQENFIIRKVGLFLINLISTFLRTK